MIKQPLFQPITSQTDVTASRIADGTVYQNTTGKLMVVLVSLSLNQNESHYAYSDNNASPALVLARIVNTNLAFDIAPMTFLVLPSNYYKITTAGGTDTTPVYWIEYS